MILRTHLKSSRFNSALSSEMLREDRAMGMAAFSLSIRYRVQIVQDGHKVPG